ncbi:MAG: hypothetical protein PHX83_03920 [Acidobacteriia bacterium]|nr:hypothetical protein [Terriglobia bacterium]
MTKPKPDFLEILKTLARHHVDFIVVGGVCAVLHGAPIATFDLDLVHSRATANLNHLLKALDNLEAHYREARERIARPELSHLRSADHHLLMTRAGPLDLLGEIGHGSKYEDLLPETMELEIDKDLKVRVLNLDTLIRNKTETARSKDKAVIAILEQTLKEKLKSQRKISKQPSSPVLEHPTHRT